jgi:hypothetical protein
VIDEVVAAHRPPLWLVERGRDRGWRLVARGETIDDITVGVLAASAAGGVWKERDP